MKQNVLIITVELTVLNESRGWGWNLGKVFVWWFGCNTSNWTKWCTNEWLTSPVKVLVVHVAWFSVLSRGGTSHLSSWLNFRTREGTWHKSWQTYVPFSSGFFILIWDLLQMFHFQDEMHPVWFYYRLRQGYFYRGNLVWCSWKTKGGDPR